MDDRDFIDQIYQLWSKTTHADTGGWEIVRDDKTVLVDIESTDRDGWEQTISFGTYEYDAQFIVTVHTAFPELVRRLHDALDEADRADHESDSRECRIAELELEVAELKADLEGLIAG